MKKEDIRIGMKVIDRSIDVTYTWIMSYRSVCSMCDSPSKLFLWEDVPIINTFGDSWRGKYCIECAGTENLEPVVQAVQ